MHNAPRNGFGQGLLRKKMIFNEIFFFIRRRRFWISESSQLLG
jgi:hypothetical protein